MRTLYFPFPSPQLTSTDAITYSMASGPIGAAVTGINSADAVLYSVRDLQLKILCTRQRDAGHERFADHLRNRKQCQCAAVLTSPGNKTVNENTALSLPFRRRTSMATH